MLRIVSLLLVISIGAVFASPFPIRLIKFGIAEGAVYTRNASTPCGTDSFHLKMNFDFSVRSMNTKVECPNGYSFISTIKCNSRENVFSSQVCPYNESCLCNQFTIPNSMCPEPSNIIYGNLTYIGETTYNGTAMAKIWGYSSNGTAIKVWTDLAETRIIGQDIITQGSEFSVLYEKWNTIAPNPHVFDIPANCTSVGARSKYSRNVAHHGLPAGRWTF